MAAADEGVYAAKRAGGHCASLGPGGLARVQPEAAGGMPGLSHAAVPTA